MRRARAIPPALMGPPMAGMGMRAGRAAAMGYRAPPSLMDDMMMPDPYSDMVPPVPVAPLGNVSSVTNANDKQSKDSRLFVGNLNTIALSKEAVESIFAVYGVVVGISMHKGYCFVQYMHPDEARTACVMEEGKHYAGQALDINVVSQPKNRTGLKRSAGKGNDAMHFTKKSRTEPDQAANMSAAKRAMASVKKGAGKGAVVICGEGKIQLSGNWSFVQNKDQLTIYSDAEAGNEDEEENGSEMKEESGEGEDGAEKADSWQKPPQKNPSHADALNMVGSLEDYFFSSTFSEEVHNALGLLRDEIQERENKAKKQ